MSFLRKLHEWRSQDDPELELDQIQATLLRERPEPYFGTHILAHFSSEHGAQDFLTAIRPHVRSAHDWWEGDVPWISLSFSYQGLVRLGLPQESLDSFPQAFRVGMEGRSAELVDIGPNAPKHWDRVFRKAQIHAAVSIFAPSPESHRAALETAELAYRGLRDVKILLKEDFGAQMDAKNSLGFKDMIGNPAIKGSGIDPLPGQGPAIAPGEFVLGYPGEGGELLSMPKPEVLGRNSSYAVVRKYHTNAGSFNQFLKDNASSEDEQELLAAKMVGRWRSGAPLEKSPHEDDTALGADRNRNNDFRYKDDPEGLRTPLGSHSRRMNPRDSKLSIMTDVNVHRIIRRATAFGPAYDPTAVGPVEDRVDRGLYFFFMSAKAMSTMEFLQSEWINAGRFTDLGQERDPIIGVQDKEVTFTVPERPVRKRYAGMHTFNTLQGGEYMFLPSLGALDWMLALDR